jgi:hypothetical protein
VSTSFLHDYIINETSALKQLALNWLLSHLSVHASNSWCGCLSKGTFRKEQENHVRIPVRVVECETNNMPGVEIVLQAERQKEGQEPE